MLLALLDNISIRSGLSCITNVSVPSWMACRTKACRTNCTHTPLEIPICGLFDVWWDLIWTHIVLLCRMENSESIFLFCNWSYLSLSHTHIHPLCPAVIFHKLPLPFQNFQLKSEASIWGREEISFTFTEVSLSLSWNVISTIFGPAEFLYFCSVVMENYCSKHAIICFVRQLFFHSQLYHTQIYRFYYIITC